MKPRCARGARGVGEEAVSVEAGEGGSRCVVSLPSVSTFPNSQRISEPLAFLFSESLKIWSVVLFIERTLRADVSSRPAERGAARRGGAIIVGLDAMVRERGGAVG